MFRQSSLPILCLLVGVFASSALGQDRAFLAVESNLPRSLILVDSVFVGRVGQQFHSLAPGARQIALEPSIPDSWLLDRPKTEVLLSAGDSLTVELDFKTTYRVESSPYGATLLHELEETVRPIGETPFLLRSDTALAGMFMLSLTGYESVRIRPGRDVLNRHSVILKPTGSNRAETTLVKTGPGRERRSRWVSVVALGLVAAGSAATIHYKFKADRRWDVYRETTDPRLKDEIDRLDRHAAVGLGVMQVGVAVLVIRLAL